MRLSSLQRAAALGTVGLLAIGVAGFLSVTAVKVILPTPEKDLYGPGQPIPSRSECINDGLRDLSNRRFTKQTAYDIEVKCEQIIQSMQGRVGAAAPQ